MGSFSSFPNWLGSSSSSYSFYATINPFDKTDAHAILSNHNLSYSTVVVGGGYRAARSTIGVSSSSANTLIYLETLVVSAGGAGPCIGISLATWDLSPTAANPSPGSDTGGKSWGFLTNTGSPFIGHSNSYSAYGAAYSAGDVIMTAIDMTNGFVYFGKNGTWLNSGVPTSGASGTGAAFGGLTGNIFPTLGCYGGNAVSYTVNFGASSFTYTPPAGYVGLHH